ncbi:MAG: hypothetical protein PHQ43_09635, partial [Dehalococcoidales bacterium]|nr:hypothetical protein [Dehalococcoidales bacterium]
MKKMVKLIGLCLILIITAALMPGCSGTEIKTTGELPQSLDGLSLTEMWSAAAEVTDIQESTAELGSFNLRADEDGGIDSLYFDFRGRNKEGSPYIYFAEMGSGGKIDIRENESKNSVSLSAHPMTVFAEIDKAGLASLEPGEAGLFMRISYQGGDVGYRHAYTDIYQLEDGQLLPLKQVIFHTDVYWCTITIFKNVKHEDTESTTTVTVNPEAMEERTSQIWFLSEDISRADTVEYIELEEEVEAGQVLDIKVGLDLQSSLAKGVSFENVKVQTGTLEKGPVWNPWRGSKYYAGDPCLLVIGDINNDTSENMTMIGSALGYNTDWEPVAWTLSSARIMGQFEYSVPAHSGRSFEVPLTYAKDVRLIEIHASSYDSETFFQPPMTSEPMPESELTRITFSKEWLLENDIKPDPETVKIIFPASWLVESPPVSADDESVELTVPT